MIDSIQQSISRSVIIGNIKNLNYDKMDFRKKTAGNPEQKKRCQHTIIFYRSAQDTFTKLRKSK